MRVVISTCRFLGGFVVSALLLAACVGSTSSGDSGKSGEGSDSAWIELIGPDGPQGWKSIPVGWQNVGETYLNAADLKRLAASPGRGTLYNGPAGRAPNLVSKATFGDLEVHLEFMVPKGSNSGIKLEGQYEIQIFDSHGVKQPTATHCGGVYPHAELLPRYHYLDAGVPPLVNAARPPGEWQTLDIVFRAPRFDGSGKKVENAWFVQVLLNGQIVQRECELTSPTGHAWHDPERPNGPLLLQGDHGPVAFRHLRVRPVSLPTSPARKLSSDSY
jgi:hypothetical protein